MFLQGVRLKFSVLFLVLIPTSCEDLGLMDVETQNNIFRDKSFRRDFFEAFLPSYLQFYKFGGLSIILDDQLKGEVTARRMWSQVVISVQFLSEGDSLLPFLQMLAENIQQQQILIVVLTTNARRILEVEYLPKKLYRGLTMLIVDPPKDFGSLKLPLDNRIVLLKSISHGNGSLNCFELWETYTVPNLEETTEEKVGQWLPSGYLDAPSKEVTSRRMNLLGTTLNCISEGETRASGVMRADNGSWVPYGWHFEGMLILERLLNFSCSWSVSPDRQYGTIQEDGTWSGMVGELIAGRADIVVGNLDNIPSRAKVIDFLFAELNNGFTVIVRSPNQLGSMWQIYLTELTPRAWLCTGCFVIISSLLYFVTSNYNPEERVRMNLHESVLFVWGAFAAQGSHKVATGISGRIAFIHVFLLAMLISAHYTSWLYSMLTVSKTIYPFNGIKSILDDGSFTFGANKGYSVLTALRVSDDPLMQRVFRNIEEHGGQVADNAEGFERLMNSNFAYIVSKLMLEDYKNKYDFVQVTDQFFSYGTGKAVAKDSPLKDVFNTAILRLYISGALDKLKRDWKEEILEKNSQTKNAITLEQIISVLALVLVMVGLSLILLLLEFLWAKKFKQSVMGRKRSQI